MLLLLTGLFWTSTAMAQDDEDPFQDLLDEDDEEFGIDQPAPAPAPAPAPDAAPQPAPAPEPELDFEDDPEGEEPDLLEEDPNANVTPGGDTAEIYRAEIERVDGMDVDDEMQAWEAYIIRYPQSAFRMQIDKRVEILEDQLADLAKPGGTKKPERPMDNRDKQLPFSQALLLESINPRRRVHVLLEWGLPDWANLGIGYEHAFGKKFSVLAQFRRRFSGPSVEAGVRWALVKSLRTKTLLSVLGDVRINASPAFFSFRPQLAFGKAFGKLEIQAQGGVDIATRTPLDLRGIGGLHLNFRATQAVAIFAETSLHIKNQSGAKGPFRFNQIAFGLRFFPIRKAKNPDNVEVNIGASIPYSSAYWQYHYGAIVGQGNIYLDK